MQEIIVHYLSKHKSIHLPGIGQLECSTEPAKLDFINKTIYPPRETVQFTADTSTPNPVNESTHPLVKNNFLPFLADRLNIPEEAAQSAFEQYVQAARSSLENQQTWTLPGIGTLQKSVDGIQLVDAFSSEQFTEPLQVEQVIRENASHTIRVGEEEKTSAQMQELLQREVKKEKWWIAVVILAVIGIAAITWYYMQPAMY